MGIFNIFHLRLAPGDSSTPTGEGEEEIREVLGEEEGKTAEETARETREGTRSALGGCSPRLVS